MSVSKPRTMIAINLNTGESTKEYVNVPCTLPKYIRAITTLNKCAHTYGVVYVADIDDEEYARFVAEV